jgi:hypothetical protein
VDIAILPRGKITFTGLKFAKASSECFDTAQLVCAARSNHASSRAQPGENTMARKYYTLAVLPKAEGQQWSPQFGDYDREVVAQELEDTKADWPKGSKFKIITSDGKQAAINAEIDALNRQIKELDRKLEELNRK